VSFPLLCDPSHREAARRRGWDPDALVGRYVALVNAALAGRSPGLTGLDLDVLFLEYDSPRAGSFEPLRFVPGDRRVVLGLVSTKTPALEPRADLQRRIEEAARFVPLERLALSPQCGFASTAPRNPLTPADQEAKLRLVVDTARAVWGPLEPRPT
jgi:5-methyltetrahydropteroyltriglutamate--homocysteine methyltransferase